MNNRVLVLGSNSFSGSNFVNFALNNGYGVIGVSRQEEVTRPYAPYLSNPSLSDFTYVQCDLNKDFQRIARLCEEYEIDSVINFAAQSMVAESWTSPSDWYQTNVVGLANLIQEFLESSWKIKKFVHFTTPEVYGSTNEWIKESFNFFPTTPYAISRAASDFHLRALYTTKGFPVIFTRAANVYGEHQRPYRIIPRTFIAALAGQRFPLHGGGHSVRSFIHIDDVSAALLRILKNGNVGECYHISTQELVSIKTVVEKSVNLLGLTLDDVCEISDDRVGKDAAYKLESSKLRSELAWTENISLVAGLERTLDWIRQDLKEILSAETEYVHRR